MADTEAEERESSVINEVAAEQSESVASAVIEPDQESAIVQPAPPQLEEDDNVNETPSLPVFEEGSSEGEGEAVEDVPPTEELTEPTPEIEGETPEETSEITPITEDEAMASPTSEDALEATPNEIPALPEETEEGYTFEDYSEDEGEGGLVMEEGIDMEEGTQIFEDEIQEEEDEELGQVDEEETEELDKKASSLEIGRLISTTTSGFSTGTRSGVPEEFDVRKQSQNKRLNKFLTSLAAGDLSEIETKSMVDLYSCSQSQDSYIKPLHGLYIAEVPPCKTDEFAWPNYRLEDRDQIYENLLIKTVLNSSVMVLEQQHVLIRRDHRNMNGLVKLLGGGRAGLDPLYSSFVGKGMLTAAVIGDRYEAPKIEAITNAIHELSHDHKAGILIIVQNSYENRLTFGLAMQRARLRGVLIDMVVVADDCFEEKKNHEGRQGLAGVLLTIKIAGGMSEKGKHMKDIFMSCRTHMMATMSGHIMRKEFRIGTGFDSDQGGTKLELTDLKDVISWLLQYATHPCRYFSLPLKPLSRLVVLINSYTQDNMFLYSAVAEAMRQLFALEVDIERVYAGNFITSLSGCRGISITLLKLYDESVLKWLDEPTNCEGWPTAKCGDIPLVMRMISKMPKRTLKSFGVRFPPWMSKMVPYVLNYVCRALLHVETMLNTYDSHRNLGSAIARGASAIAHVNRNQELDLNSAYSFLQQIAFTLEDSMLGATGALYALLFDGASQEFLCFSKHSEMQPFMWARALENAVKNLTIFGKLKEGDCNMVDALAPTVRAVSVLKKSVDGLTLMTEVYKAAEQGMLQTKTMRSTNHIKADPEVGAYAVSIIFAAILEAMKDRITY